MGTPFMGEIKILGFDKAPKGWAQCNGQFLPINQNQALFSLLGTTYGGNGQTTFALPNLQGRAPNHFDSGFNLGQAGGETAHTVTMNEMPTHLHFTTANMAVVDANNNSTQGIPTGNVWSNSGKTNFTTAASNAVMGPSAVTNVGGSQAHTNMQPYLVLNFCIALQGIFPSQN